MISGVSKVVIEVEDQERVGVAFPQPPVEQPFGSWSMFDEAEGNRFALEQTESDAP